MNCKNCNNPLPDGVKFCGKCGKNVSEENLNKDVMFQSPVETKKTRSTAEIIRKIFQIVSIVLFLGVISGVSSMSHTASGLSEELANAFMGVFLIIFLILEEKWRKNRKTGTKWFGWKWMALLFLVSVIGFGVIIFPQVLTSARHKAFANGSWAVYNLPESNFSARFPLTPVHNTQNQNTENGIIKIDTYKQSDSTDSILYAVNVTEIPSVIDLSNPTTMLENSVKLSGKDGTVLNSSQTTNNGYPAISYYIQFDHSDKVSIIRGLNILAGNRLYQLLTAYDKSQESLLEYDKFVDSFQIN